MEIKGLEKGEGGERLLRVLIWEVCKEITFLCVRLDYKLCIGDRDKFQIKVGC